MCSTHVHAYLNQPLPSGHQIADYEISDVLGQDGYEVTYLAKKQNTGSLFVLREFFPVGATARMDDFTIQPEGSTGRKILKKGLIGFLEQSEILAAIAHHSIEAVVEYFEANNTAYRISRFEEGETLAIYISKNRTLDEKHILDILLPLLGGLAFAHDCGLIHGEISPIHVLVRPDGTPLLFGFSTDRWKLANTPGCPTVLRPSSYTPIEQLTRIDTEALRPSMDIYALGTTIYFAMTGLIPPDSVSRSGVMLGQPDPLTPLTVAGKGRFSEQLLYAIDSALEILEVNRPADIMSWQAIIKGKTISRAGMDKETIPSVEKTTISKGGRRKIFIKVSLLACAIGLLGAVGYYFLPDWVDQMLTAKDKNDVTNTPLLDRKNTGADSSIIPLDLSQQKIPATEEHAEAALSASKAVVISLDATEIEGLLSGAAKDFKASRLTGPPDNNAFDKYLKILEADPGNIQALKGVENLVKYYEDQAKTDERRKNRKNSKINLKRALAILESKRLNDVVAPAVLEGFNIHAERLRRSIENSSATYSGRR